MAVKIAKNEGCRVGGPNRESETTTTNSLRVVCTQCHVGRASGGLIQVAIAVKSFPIDFAVSKCERTCLANRRESVNGF